MVHDLQNRISRFANDRLTAAMDDCLEKIIPSELLVKLDSLTLDIGEVELDSLEQTLEQRIIEALEQKLLQQIVFLRKETGTGITNEAGTVSTMGSGALLEYFLLTGRLPWWAKQDAGFNIDSLFGNYLLQEPATARALIVRIGQNENVRKRLVYQFSEATIQKLVTVLEPTEAAYILDYHKEIVRVQQQEQVVKSETTAFEKAVWLFILNYILVERGSEFNRKEFAKLTLVQIAHSFNLGYFELLKIFYQAIVAELSAEKTLGSLELLITQLIHEEPIFREAQIPVPKSIRAKDADAMYSKIALLQYYFRHGSLPPDHHGYTRNDLAAIFAELVESTPETLRLVLRETIPIPFFSERFYALLDQDKGKELLQKLYPVKAKLLFGLAALVGLLQTKKYFTLGSPSSLREELTALALSQLVSSPENGTDELSYLNQFIYRLSVVYRLDQQGLIRKIYSGVQEEFRQGILYSNLPQLIGTLAEGAIGQVALEKENQPVKTDEVPDELVSTGMLDALQFMLRYGVLPWWGRAFFQTGSLAELIREMIDKAPADMLSLLRFAGGEKNRQERLLSIMDIPGIYRMIELTGADDTLLGLIRSIAKNMVEKMMPDELAVVRVMMTAYWDQLITYQYQHISIPVFFRLTVIRLAQKFGADPVIIAKLLKETVAGQDGTVIPVEDIDILIQYFIQAKDTDEQDLRQELALLAAEHKDLPFIRLLIKRIPVTAMEEMKKIIGKKAPSFFNEILTASEPIQQVALREAIAIIRYLLHWNRLPDSVAVQDKKAADDFLVALIKMVYRLDQAMLSAILNESFIQKEKITEIRELIPKKKGGTQKKIHQLLTGILNKTGTEPVTAEREIAFNNTQQDEVKNLMRIFFEKDQLVTVRQLHAKAIEVLTHFFRWQKPPDQWQETPALPFKVLLLQLFRLLFTENRAVLQTLLQDQTHIPESRIFFHELADISKGGLDKEMALFAAPYHQWFRQQQLEYEETKLLFTHDLITEIIVPEPANKTTENKPALLLEFFDQLLLTAPVADNYFQHIGDEQEIIRKLLQLFAADKKGLEQLFSGNKGLAVTRIRIYEILLTEAGYRERELLQFLQPYLQRDTLEIIDQQTTQAGSGDMAGLPEKIAEWLMTQDLSIQKQAIASPLLVHQLLFSRNRDLLKILLEKARPGGGTDLFVLFQSMEYFFEKAIQGNLEQDLMKDRLRQFYLVMLRTGQGYKTAQAWLQAFIVFLLQQANPVNSTVLYGLLSYTEQTRLTAIPGLAESVDQVIAGLRWLISRITGKEIIQVANRITPQEPDEAEKRKQAQLALIRKELEMEKQRQEEALRKESEKIEQDKHNKIYIRNAGLVLFHPFLSTYLSRLGLLAENRFIDEAAQHRAVLLLQYLVNGRTETEEFELALNKVMCGLPVYETVPLSITLTETEIAVSEEIFQVIFQRWEKMKNSTIPGFRASFIQREGALMRNEEDWQLRVEQRTYDMLLETLPWSFGMIKLAWMNQILTVEWI